MLLKFRLALVAVVLATSSGAVALAQGAAPITPRSAVADLDGLKVTVEVPEFRIGGHYDLSDPAAWENGAPGGVTLESLGGDPMKVSYIAMGTPETDESGKIVNAIVISSFYSGDATSMYFNWVEGQPGNGFSKGPLIGPGLLFDTDRFYVVMFDALGLWGASKPSDGLGLQFPEYSYYDMVQANYRALRDDLNVGHVVLSTGVSMGGTQAYYWGLMHPEFVDAVIPVGGATATDGDAPIAAWTFQLAKAGLESDPIWRATGGDYYALPKSEHPVQGPAYHWSVLNLTGYDLNYRQSQGWDAVKGLVFTWGSPEQTGMGAGVMELGAKYDAVDLKYRVEVGERHNINALLPEYKTRLLAMHVSNDQWLTADKARASVQAIPGGQLVEEESPIAHYAVFSMFNSQANDPMLNTFLHDIGILQTPGKVCDAVNYRSPRVNMNPDPDSSFWLDNMTHPFPPKFTHVTDRSGQDWEIGYLDEVCEGIENPDTLVIVHGKGAFASHYGYLMKFAVEQGFRVIAIDMPHAGLSGPGNVDKPMARDLEDIRSAFHGVIVDQLGVDQAYYLGHSFGGQAVLGYALDYPEAVKGLILEGPAGLEIFPKSVAFGDEELGICDPAITHDFAAWEKAWGPTGALAAEMGRDEQSVRDFFHFRERDPVTGAVSPSKFGYFRNDSEYARLHTDQRVAMISGNPAEFEQWVTAFIYDIWTICSENDDTNPEALLKRAPQIEAPIFLAFGAREPFIPSTGLNGLTDMANEVITPFVKSMRAADRDVTTKIYPGVGHFIHTDVPFEFATDTVSFLKTGKVDVMTPDVIDALVNGVAAEAAAGGAGGGAAADKPSGFSK
ncbi:alpha/beta fold hydrolase [Tropicimonas sp. IMCC34043]|uniref:alpha/beta fold hydrolase n=1 Tax=Tropicimonas sp. IMCC34043 TaxID=2248760 RepID=UPI0018E546F9|nr:alpha/beta fold hydrolase [Tropicimonas sp. IMCC34043]